MPNNVSRRFVSPDRIVPAPTTVNADGYPAYERSLEDQFVQMLMCNVMGNTYYASADKLAEDAERVHRQMIMADPAFYAAAIAYAREHGYMRTQPVYGLALLSSVRPDLFEAAFHRVVRTPNDLLDFATIVKSMGRGEGGRTIKRTSGRWLAEKMTPYWAIKYGATKQGYNLRDLARAYHPRGENHAIDYLLRQNAERHGPEKWSHDPQFAAVEALKVADTDEDRARLITEGRLPHEVATPFAGQSAEVWGAIIPQLPIFALVRNLATLERHGVLNRNRALIEVKLTDEKVIRKSMMFPFRFLDAFNNVQSSWLQDALRRSIDISVGNLPTIAGRVAVFLDVSGSMNQRMTTAAIFAISLARGADDPIAAVFNTATFVLPVSRIDSVLSQAAQVHAGGGTNTGTTIEHLEARGHDVDTVVLITDEQQNAGNPFFANLAGYRRRVGHPVRCVVMCVEAYTGGHLSPEADQDTFYTFGWSDAVLRVAAMAANGVGGIVSEIRRASDTAQRFDD